MDQISAETMAIKTAKTIEKGRLVQREKGRQQSSHVFFSTREIFWSCVFGFKDWWQEEGELSTELQALLGG